MLLLGRKAGSSMCKQLLELCFSVLASCLLQLQLLQPQRINLSATKLKCIKPTYSDPDFRNRHMHSFTGLPQLQYITPVQVSPDGSSLLCFFQFLWMRCSEHMRGTPVYNKKAASWEPSQEECHNSSCTHVARTPILHGVTFTLACCG